MKIRIEVTNSDIGTRINERSSELGISQNELASLLKITIEHLIAIETDMLSQDVDVLIDLCRILKCTSDYLCCFSSDPKKTRDLQ